MLAGKGIEQRGQKWNEPKAQMGEVTEVVEFANSPVFFGPFLDKATEDSFRTERDYDNTAQFSDLDDKQTETAMQKLLGPKGEANPVLGLITTLLQKPVFKLTEHTRAEYFDFLSHVMDKNPELVQEVQAISITRNRNANYDENIYQFETVIGELIACSSLRRLTLNQFHAHEIVRILATLKSQTKLEYLNLCSNSLSNHHLSIVVRSLPKSKQPMALELNGNELGEDNAYIEQMVASMHNNVNVTIGQQVEPKLDKK